LADGFRGVRQCLTPRGKGDVFQPVIAGVVVGATV
jgi:hypothetical protein